MASRNYLRKRITYVEILIPFLLIISMLYLGQATLVDMDFVSVYVVEAHIILLILAAFTFQRSEDLLGKQPALKETGKGFIIANLIGVAPIYIFFAWATPLDLFQDATMILYFIIGATIEELVFRYTLPRLLYAKGYGLIRTHLICGASFSMMHWFVWNMSPSAFLLGAGFGTANAIALQFSNSFAGVVWAHCLHNLWLSGASGISMMIGTLFMGGAVIVTNLAAYRRY